MTEIGRSFSDVRRPRRVVTVAAMGAKKRAAIRGPFEHFFAPQRIRVNTFSSCDRPSEGRALCDPLMQ